jgi:hypothetical protein
MDAYMSPLLLGISSFVLIFLSGLVVGLTFNMKDKKPIFFLNYLTAMFASIVGMILLYRLVVNCR